MNICAIIVWYNPDFVCVNNILTYSKFVKKCYIVDNSECDNTSLAKKISNAIYIPNFKNLGIAAALNKGCGIAKNEGFEWCMTMDQDSAWESGFLEEYLSNVENLATQIVSVKSYAPTPMIERSYLGKIKQKIKNLIIHNAKDSYYCFCDRVICSGNIINLICWEEMHGFNEKLFIDEVDFDYCYRLREKKYDIIKFNEIFFFHVLGNNKKQFLFSKDSHSSTRLFYMFRNQEYIIRKYPKYAKKYKYRNELISLFIQRCIFDIHFISNLKAFVAARKDKSLYEISNKE